MQRVCVFVDGENFRHSICDLFETFDKQDHLPKTARWGDFFDHLVNIATEGTGVRLRTYWYVVRHLDFNPHKLYKPTEEDDDGNTVVNDKLLRYLKSKYKYKHDFDNFSGDNVMSLVTRAHDKILSRKGVIQKRFEGWKTIYNGISSKHKNTEFRHEGSIAFDLMNDRFLKEKSVDVALAVDMLDLKDIYDVAIIVSGDQDYVPAVKTVKNKGKIVVNISFKKQDGDLLPGGAWRLNVETDYSLAINHEELSTFLNLSSLPSCAP